MKYTGTSVAQSGSMLAECNGPGAIHCKVLAVSMLGFLSSCTWKVKQPADGLGFPEGATGFSLTIILSAVV